MRLIISIAILFLCWSFVLAQADEGWIELFNGKDLTGWKLVHEGGRQSWSVVNGILTNVSTHEQPGTDLMTEQKFMDHELHVEFRVPPGGNSGVYVQGRYECQIADSAHKTTPTMADCGGIWATSDPLVQAAKPAGEWQTYDIKFTAPKVDAEGKIIEPARMT
ncbi:MAG: 3-keto-disaccharide hydrolase, partial [Candidatus Zipacnadales bacterium]